MLINFIHRLAITLRVASGQVIRILSIVSLLGLSGCQEQTENLDVSFLDTDTSADEPGVIDLWINENYTNPYNIVVDYKWKPYEVSTSRILVPPKEEQVIPVMDLVRKTWIAPYVQLAGEDFIKTQAPRQFVLVGSPQFNNDGTMVLGEAESGRKIILFVINEFDRTNVVLVKEMLHTLHHEFAHILQQTVATPREFKQITAAGYTATWYNTSPDMALALGFITPYARSSTDEDFVEMISMMLVEGKEGYEAMLDQTLPEAQALLRRKEALVVAYFQEVWNMDFYALQEATQEAIYTATQ